MIVCLMKIIAIYKKKLKAHRCTTFVYWMKENFNVFSVVGLFILSMYYFSILGSNSNQ